MINLNNGPLNMRITILKSTDPLAWYAKHVGQTFPVYRFEPNHDPSQGIPEDVYWVRTGDAYNTLNYVRASDAEVAPEPELPAEVREAISNFIRRHNIRVHEYSVAKVPLDGCETKRVDELCAALAPLWPKQPQPMQCPHCGSGLLWSEDRGAHCDGCDDFNPETDLPPHPSADVEKLAEECVRKCFEVELSYKEQVFLDRKKNEVSAIVDRAFAEKDAEIARLHSDLIRRDDDTDAAIGQMKTRAERAEAERDEWQLACANWASTICPKLNAHSLAEAETNLNALLAERDRLRAEAKELAKTLTDTAWALFKKKSECAQLAELQRINQADYTEAGWQRARELESQLAAAQEDKALIERLHAHYCTVHQSVNNPTRPRLWFVTIYDGLAYDGEGETFRAAASAALAKLDASKERPGSTIKLRHERHD